MYYSGTVYKNRNTRGKEGNEEGDGEVNEVHCRLAYGNESQKIIILQIALLYFKNMVCFSKGLSFR